MGKFKAEADGDYPQKTVSDAPAWRSFRMLRPIFSSCLLGRICSFVCLLSLLLVTLLCATFSFAREGVAEGVKGKTSGEPTKTVSKKQVSKKQAKGKVKGKTVVSKSFVSKNVVSKSVVLRKPSGRKNIAKNGAEVITIGPSPSGVTLARTLEDPSAEKQSANNLADPKLLHKQPQVGSGPIQARFSSSGFPQLEGTGVITALNTGTTSVTEKNGNKIFFTVDGELQNYSREILGRLDLPWGAILALEPTSGRVLAFSSYSSRPQYSAEEIAAAANFPAASLFKMITAAAAVERQGLGADSTIQYRGAPHSLSRANYFPDARRDTRRITLAEALGTSNNPAFARIALNSLSQSVLSRYASHFGFNKPLQFEAPVAMSTYDVPSDDYELARTAAGYSGARISILHAGVLMATIANQGRMMRPFLIDHMRDATGKTFYTGKPFELGRAILPGTASQLLEMMKETCTKGTARRYFSRLRTSSLRGIDVSGKTGTLNGKDPDGTYFWFVGAAPAERPEVVVATLVIDPGGARTRAGGVASQFLERYFGANLSSQALLADPALKSSNIKGESLTPVSGVVVSARRG